MPSTCNPATWPGMIEVALLQRSDGGASLLSQPANSSLHNTFVSESKWQAASRSKHLKLLSTKLMPSTCNPATWPVMIEVTLLQRSNGGASLLSQPSPKFRKQ